MRKPLSQLASYQALRTHALEIKAQSLRNLFAQNPTRYTSFSLQFGHLLLDYSKNRINAVTVEKLVSMLHECEVESWRDKMFAGELINFTQHRGAQHAALRNLDDSVWGKKQQAVLQRIDAFAARVYASNCTDVVNIGIGGSHLGPLFVCDALRDVAQSDVHVHFVANVDATEISRVLKQLNPASTLFILTSKSFATQETLANANTAKNWLAKDVHVKNNLADHFIAVSADVEKAMAFGIPQQQIFPMWDEIGGRFSLWSAAGIAIALYIGMPAFKALLRGAHAMDVHFINAAAQENIPVMLALLEIWSQHFMGASVHAVLPYDTRLRYLPAYLQQLVMESNGKQVDREGNTLDVPGAPIVFGDVGTNSQHSFFQLLHQGSHEISADFIGVVQAAHQHQAQHDMLLANMIGQTQALMSGQTLAEAQAQDGEQNAAYRVFPGNRASNTILLKQLTPYTLGVLLAMYEHKVFVQGIILNINSFDQMGVELGKRLANELLKRIQSSEQVTDQDSSTNALINFYKQYS